MSYQVNWEIQALDLTAGFLSDDPAGVAALWDSVSHLADEQRPPESFPYGSPDLRACRCRVFYTIDEQKADSGDRSRSPSSITGPRSRLARKPRRIQSQSLAGSAPQVLR